MNSSVAVLKSERSESLFPPSDDGHYVVLGQEFSREKLSTVFITCCICSSRQGHTDFFVDGRHLCSLPIYPLRLMCASLNNSETVLAFSAYNPQTSQYETYIVETKNVKRPGHKFLFHKQTNTMQGIHFITTYDDKSSYFLYYVDQVGVELYRIDTKKEIADDQKRTVCYTIESRPTQNVGFVMKNILWHEWDPSRDLLYVLLGRSGTSIRCCSFSTPRTPEVIFETSIPIEVPPLNPKSYVVESIPFRHAQAISDIRLNLHVVDNEKGAVCIVQQNVEETRKLSSDSRSEIRMTIFLLHHRVKVESVVPISLHSFHGKRAENVTSMLMNEMLAIYIPGVFLQLLDCFGDHIEEIGTFYGDELLPSLSGPICRTYGEIMSPHVVEIRSAVLHYLSLSKSALLQWCFSTDTTRKQIISMFHFIVAHMHDRETGKELILSLCREHPEKMHPDIVKACLLDLSFMELDATQSRLAQHIPLGIYGLGVRASLSRIDASSFGGNFYVTAGSNALTLLRSQRISYRETRRRDSMPTPVPHTPGLHTTLISPQSSYSRRGSSRSLSFSSSVLSPNSRTPSRTPSREIPSSSEKRRETYVGPVLSSPNSEELWDMRRTALVEAIGEELNDVLSSRDFKSTALSMAETYVGFLTKSSDDLYNTIVEAYPDTTPQLWELRLLLQFHAACEEMRMPFPRNFISHITRIGFRLLPEKVFMQYLDRNIFSLDESMLTNVIQLEAQSPEFAYFLARHGSSSMAALAQCMKSDKRARGYVLQYYYRVSHGSATTRKLWAPALQNNASWDAQAMARMDVQMAREDMEIGDSDEDSKQFLPLTVLRSAMRSTSKHTLPPNVQDAVEFVVSNAGDVYFLPEDLKK